MTCSRSLRGRSSPASLNRRYPTPKKSESTFFKQVVRYESGTATLDVVFKSGKVYQYFEKPASTFEEIRALAASGGSVGSFVNSDVKGRDAYARI
jgi:hypothetical protein